MEVAIHVLRCWGKAQLSDRMTGIGAEIHADCFPYTSPVAVPLHHFSHCRPVLLVDNVHFGDKFICLVSSRSSTCPFAGCVKMKIFHLAISLSCNCDTWGCSNSENSYNLLRLQVCIMTNWDCDHLCYMTPFFFALKMVVSSSFESLVTVCINPEDYNVIV